MLGEEIVGDEQRDGLLHMHPECCGPSQAVALLFGVG